MCFGLSNSHFSSETEKYRNGGHNSLTTVSAIMIFFAGDTYIYIQCPSMGEDHQESFDQAHVLHGRLSILNSGNENPNQDLDRV